MRVVWVNQARIDHEREMERERDWLIREVRCYCCHGPAPEFVDVGVDLPICSDCIAKNGGDLPPEAA